MAMQDSNLATRYFLNLVTGEVVFLSDDFGMSDEDERLAEEIDGSNDYVAIERIPSHEAYQWMVDFVEEKRSLQPTNRPPKHYSQHYTAKARFAASRIPYITSMNNGCKRGISGEMNGSKLPSKSGSRAFFDLQV